MGLTNRSVGAHAVDTGLVIEKQTREDRVIALAGNPNVGKSTVFNALTGMNQHTGNWPGKTVSNAQGYCRTKRHSYVMVDIPGTYSLMAHSAEEEVARNFLCFGGADAVVVVCDATCLERNLNLVLQTLEITPNVVVCVNLMDEARRKRIRIDLGALSRRLGVPVIGVIARKKKSLSALTETLDRLSDGAQTRPAAVRYPEPVEQAIAAVEPLVRARVGGRLPSRWLSLQLLDPDEALLSEVDRCLGWAFSKDAALEHALATVRESLLWQGVDSERLKDMIVSALVGEAESVCAVAVRRERETYGAFDQRLDRLLTSRATGYPVMLLLLAFILWLTIVGANYPSQLLSDALF
ncbi:MAG: FeoB small GTPase domain-containing protein, partial [Clostridiales bacterium]|nr:FeoB small GTPase domain-containing protein [Clostridiales bacterium]